MPILAVLVAIGIATISALALTSTPTASAETPAERCARETAAYNSAWAQSWAASNGKPASQAPPPPVPYVCVDPGPPTSSTTPPPSVTAPTIPTETNTPNTGGPNMGAHAPTDIPDAGQTPIVPIPTSPERQRLPRQEDRDESPSVAGTQSQLPTADDPGAASAARTAPLPGGGTIQGEAVPEFDAYWDLSDLGRRSPTLRKQYQYLTGPGDWTITFGTSGKGTYTRVNGEKEIVIDVSTVRGGNWDAVTRPLAHEMGHALHTLPPDPTADDMLTGEGHAVLNELKVRDEIMSSGGPDIGFSGDDRDREEFLRLYGDWQSGRITQQQAAYGIGQRHAYYNPSTCPQINYRTYYESGCP
ncbi:hypothetical protein O4158_20995 [Gordonia amicalis]|uniref:hypothetical protein n=1 Tax=Gordonia amicalis TaxID=89053 RepID=UPI0022B528EC|nr:hypothetical protein [Gordonia amicalis]MCZ4581517.1 hypothetical protein [Gordonia amicalis]